MAQSEYTTAVLADSPVAFWKMDEASGLPQDSSGNALHFTSTSGSPEYQYSSPFTGAYGIRLSGDDFQRSVVSTVTDNLTVEAWINITGSDGGPDVFVNGTSGSGNGWGIEVSATTFRVLTNINGTDPSQGPVCVGANWMQVALIRRSSVWEWYLNGDTWNANAGSGVPNTPALNCLISFGASASGVVSNVSVYETALSAARIRAHYEAAIDWTSKPLNTTARSTLVLA